MAKYRGFRHVARSSYGIDLDWRLMSEGIGRLEKTSGRFEQAVLRYLSNERA